MKFKRAINIAKKLGWSVCLKKNGAILTSNMDIQENFESKEEFIYWVIYLDEVENSVLKYEFNKNPYVEWNGEYWVRSDYSREREKELRAKGRRKHKINDDNIFDK